MELNLQTIITGLSLMGMAGMGVAQFKSKSRGESGDIVKFYKDRMEDYKLIAETTRKEYADKYEDMLRKFGILEGQFNTEKALREQYESILKDKNPETQNFMTLVTTAITDQQNVNKEVVQILKEIHAMAVVEHDREFKVDATVIKK